MNFSGIKMKTFRLCAFMTLILAVLAGTGHSQIYPVDEPFRSVSPCPLSRPGYLSSVTDTNFGTKITRLTDATAFGTSNVRHAYAKVQPWNCNQSLILMGWGWILDGSTYQILRKITLPPQETKWSHINPNKLYGISGNRFVSVDATTGAMTTVHTFTGYSALYMGPWEGNLSKNDSMVVFLTSQSASADIIVYDIAHDSILATKSMASLGYTGSVVDWVSISQSGRYVVINGRGSSDNTVKSYTRSLTYVATVVSMGEHGDLGYDAAGNEVLVQTCPFQMARLDNGQKTSLPLGGQCGHVSTRNFQRPGWCYAGTNGSSSDMLAIKLDNSGLVERFTHHRSSENVYEAQAQPVPSPDGKRIIFASNWNGTAEINSYVVFKPGVDKVTLTTTTLPAGKTNTAYSQTLAVSGGTPPYVWSLIAGSGKSLPPGLSLNGSTGAISGTPSTAGTFNFTVKVMDAGSKADTSDFSIVVQAPLLLGDGWLQADIGPVGVAGEAGNPGGIFTVMGSGGDIWNTADTFHYVYKTLNSDGFIVARVVSQENSAPFAKAGVMIRASLNSDASHTMLNLTPANGVWNTCRLSAGAASVSAAGSASTAPCWVKMARSGNVFTAYESSNGTSWTPVGSSQTISMPSTAYAGLAVVSHINTQIGTAVFDNVQLSTATSGEMPGSRVSAAGLNVSPNPCAGNIRIFFDLPADAFTSLKIFDVKGRLVRSLAEGALPNGSHEIRWGASSFPNGLYLVELKYNGAIHRQKVLLVH